MSAHPPNSPNLIESIHSQSQSLLPFLKSTRHKLHQHPELLYQEKQTSLQIQQLLKEWDIPYTTNWGKNIRKEDYEGEGGYGIVAQIGTGRPPCILLRADMDALPVSEETGVEYKSVNEGKMHACGHDGHVTMLLGATKILKEMESELKGTVRIAFQPAEEIGAGGKRMVEEGLAELEPKASYAFGMHIWPSLPAGQIGCRKGAQLAAFERFHIDIEGVGGHAAMPHLTKDPIVAGSYLVTELQTLVSRSLSPLESGVVSVTHFQSGTGAYNAIPPRAELRGTIRSLSTESLLKLRKSVEEMTLNVAKLHGCTATISYGPDYYPPTVNDSELHPHAVQIANAVGEVVDVQPTMGAEDFSFIAEKIPSVFFFLGQGGDYGLHHPKFLFRDEVLPKGVALHVNLALGMLHLLNEKGTE